VRGPFGTFRAELELPTAGRYRLFADVAPRGAGSQIVMEELVVEGPPSAAFDLAAEAARRSTRVPESVDGTRVRWVFADPLPAQRTVPLVARLETPDGAPVPDLEPYLGAMGHLMLVHEDGATLVHCHPDGLASAEPGTTMVTFLARFPKPGRYRGWGQFQRAGRVITTDFVVNVPEAQ
jgi:hypothetical protein